tara:strand:- start:313 stop:1401 length:1089 start_codon:yes stop_codon:yes gene_type:complete
MKILYISPENTVGTLNIWKDIHNKNGHYCRYVTFFSSPKNYGDDICLDLPFNFSKSHMSRLRNIVYQFYNGSEGYFKERIGCPPIWEPKGLIDRKFLQLKDVLWRPIVEKAIEKYELYDFDVVHFESGMDFLKNEFFVEKLNLMGKKIICHYHGEDLRSRGVMPLINSLSHLNLTNELDLLNKHPNIEYLFLPFVTSRFIPKKSLNKHLRVAHAPTNRFYKGSELIIDVCKKLHFEGEINFDLIENQPHSVALERKGKADIFIDQIGNKGGWGYGMNSVESLSMGICTLTEMNDTYNAFIPDHPFIDIKQDDLEKTLRLLIKDRDKIFKYGKKGREWVQRYHDISIVAQKLYEHYRTIGLVC